ncbi:MAG: hypothetical protein GT600_09520 [Bacteroidales bacterium]|nr:hypothetical protein [Bacteroidales bacterium]HOU03150.1 hypothetical protein [Bacteroidales bacterium]HQK69138.1 hypothetical protein [Bacteroidales bacterium]
MDIDTAIELKHNGIPIPCKYVVRDTARKSMEEITLEIEKAKKNWKESGIAGEDDEWALRWKFGGWSASSKVCKQVKARD